MARIAIIDDEVNLLRTLARLLEREGHDVVTGSDFAQISETLWPGRFDLLVTDIVMPDFDGLDVLREVAHARGCREPIVLLTGLPSVESAAEAVRSGAFDYVSKPVSKERLLEIVSRALRHVQLLRERDRALQKEMDLLRNLAVLGEQASLLSHEIRTPITSLRQALHAVADKLGIDDRIVVESLIDNITRIERLLAATLSFAKPVELRRRAMTVVAWCPDAVGQARKLPTVAEMRIEASGLEAAGGFDGDPQLLGQVAVNLLRNSAEACNGRGRITIAATADERSVTVDFTDDGPGVPIERRDEIFRPFHSSKDGGTGIGLAFSRKVVEAHGGSLDLVTRTNPGASFRVWLPRTPPTPSQWDSPS